MWRPTVGLVTGVILTVSCSSSSSGQSAINDACHVTVAAVTSWESTYREALSSGRGPRGEGRLVAPAFRRAMADLTRARDENKVRAIGDDITAVREYVVSIVGDLHARNPKGATEDSRNLGSVVRQLRQDCDAHIAGGFVAAGAGSRSPSPTPTLSRATARQYAELLGRVRTQLVKQVPKLDRCARQPRRYICNLDANLAAVTAQEVASRLTSAALAAPGNKYYVGLPPPGLDQLALDTFHAARVVQRIGKSAGGGQVRKFKPLDTAVHGLIAELRQWSAAGPAT